MIVFRKNNKIIIDKYNTKNTTKIIYDLKEPFVNAIPVDMKNIDAEITKLINVNGKAILLMNLFIFSFFISSGLLIYYNLDKYCITSTILLKEE